MSFVNTEDRVPYLPHVWETWDKLYWGLLGYKDKDKHEHPGDLAHLTPIEIYNYVAAELSIRLNRPAPMDQIAAVIVEVWVGVQNAYGAGCALIGPTATDEICLPVIGRLEEAWLIIETEAGVLMPPEYRFSKYHSPVMGSQ